MKITSFIIRTLCAGTVGSLACQAAMQAYADDVPSTFVEGNYSPEVARYVQSIAGVALASGIHDYDENATSSYQVLAQVLNSGNVTELPEDLKRAIGMLTGYVPDPNEIIQPIMSRKQIERMRKMADRIKNLMEEKYGVDLEDCTNIMKRTLAPSIPDILRSCGMEGTQLPATTAFRPRLGKALNEAYARLAAPKLPAAGMAQYPDNLRMIGKIIPIPRHAAPCQGPLNRSRRKRNDLPLLRERKRQPAPAATNNTLRMSSDAGPILRNAERRYARSPALFPSNGMQHRHNRMMPLQAPSFPRCGRTGAFSYPGFSNGGGIPS